MERVARNAGELELHLMEQLQFLHASAQAYDAGSVSEFRRLAATMRLLFHSTSKSHSLASQLGIVATRLFHDASFPFDPRNQLSHSGAVRIGFGGPAGRNGAVPLPLFDQSPVPPRRISFEPWWNGVVFVDTQRVEFSRADVILAVANQDGGAHVDPQLDRDYSELTRGNSLGLFETLDGRELPHRNRVPATIRHITFEVLKTLDPRSAQVPPRPQGFEVEILAAARTKGCHPRPIPHSNQTKLGRNDPCSCGSGRKYKVCCLSRSNPTW